MKISNNKDRAEVAFRTVQKFSQLSECDYDDMETKISDLLCNLRHLADEKGVDFMECFSRGSDNYVSELQQEVANKDLA
jgi:hypothetical protein